MVGTAVLPLGVAVALLVGVLVCGVAPGLARFNDLDHLRDLRPGQSLRFPPLR